MFKNTIYYLVTFLVILLFLNGCKQSMVTTPKKESNTQVVQLTLNNAVLSLANQLSKNNKLSSSDTGSITLTSFVDLTQLNKTSQLGRVLAESLFSELFIRGFNITDFRGQNAIAINNKEFFITRNITKLQSKVSNTYILVGTYSKIDENIVINSRILDNKTGKIVSSARVMYSNEDCSIYGICNNTQRKIKLVSNTNNKLIAKSTPVKKILF